jgi:hypothetical protein
MAADGTMRVIRETKATTVTDLPYGEYVVRVNKDASTHEKLLVNTKESWLRIGLVYSPGDDRL